MSMLIFGCYFVRPKFNYFTDTHCKMSNACCESNVLFFWIRFYANEITIKSHHVVLFWYRVTELSQQFFAFQFGSIFNICFSNAIIPSIGELYKLFRIDTRNITGIFFYSSLSSVIFFSVLFSFLFLSIYHTFTLRITVQFFVSLFHNFYFQFVFISIGELKTTTSHFYLRKKKEIWWRKTQQLCSLFPHCCFCRTCAVVASNVTYVLNGSLMCVCFCLSHQRISLCCCVSLKMRKRKNDKHQIK